MEGTTGLDTSFGSIHFGTARLGDLRRTKRPVRVANEFVRHPGGTFPDKLPDPAQLDAFYDLMAAEEVTHQSVLEPHLQHTRAAMRGEPGVVLILHDTTVLDYSGLDIPELGQVGNGHGRGYYCHNSLAVTAERRVLGLAHQILHRRRHVPAGDREFRKNLFRVDCRLRRNGNDQQLDTAFLQLFVKIDDRRERIRRIGFGRAAYCDGVVTPEAAHRQKP